MGVKGVCTGIGAAYRTTRSNKISASQARQRNAYGRINVCTYVVNKIMTRGEISTRNNGYLRTEG